MTRQVVTVDENAPLAEAAGLMQTHRVKRLPVVNSAGMVGIISRMDLLHAYVLASAKDAAAPMGDAAIQEQLTAELARRSWVPHRSFRAQVSNGMVDLFGVIWDERQRTALRVAAENVPGVKEVRDHLKFFDPSTLL
jgi:CBS domain-containing protein